MTANGAGPRVLMVATKSPWPPIDGGRLIMAETLRAVAAAGADITLVSPAPEDDNHNAAASRADADVARVVTVTKSMRPWVFTLLRPTTPATIVRQANDATLEAVERLVAEQKFDVAHAEQLHSLTMLAPARKRGIPILLRAQNVESDLWAGAARAMPIAAPWLMLQAALLRRWEGQAVANARVTATLTSTDAWRLSNLAKRRGEVVHVAAPFAQTLPAGPPLPGNPAIALAAGGWIPNHDGARWFLERVWPLVLARLPAARLHLFGARVDRMPRSAFAHAAAADSSEMFPAGGIHVVPLRVASGVRMKILEAWARGIAVVATDAAAVGLDEGEGRALARASTPEVMALAIETLAHDPDERERLIEAGRRALARHHEPAAIGARWIDLYRYAAQ